MCAISTNSYDWDWSESEGKRPKPTPLPHKWLWFNIRCCKSRKNSKKKSHKAEKLIEAPFELFQRPFCRQTSKKLKGDPLRKKSFEKSLTMRKN